jgi:broad specificity phosphatase PhoE
MRSEEKSERVTTVLLTRHGETVWNREERVQGHGDSALTDLGRKQALALAERLARLKIDAVYASDLGRVAQTLAPYVGAVDCPVVTSTALREKCFGAWEGLTSRELEAGYPELWHRYHDLRDIQTVPPGGETWADVATRVVGFLRLVVERHDRETILLVGHGGSLRPLVLHTLGAPLECLTHMSVDNAGLTTLQFRGPDVGRVVSLNDCSHLESLS